VGGLGISIDKGSSGEDSGVNFRFLDGVGGVGGLGAGESSTMSVMVRPESVDIDRYISSLGRTGAEPFVVMGISSTW